jgi:predicted HicB family RNase H-like nuclease
MIYKRYTAKIEYSDEDECFVGHIIGIQDIVGFHGDSVQALRSAFQEAVDDYLETCRLVKKPPQQPYSGHLTLDIPPEIHAAIATAAQSQGKSIDRWAADMFLRETRV